MRLFKRDFTVLTAKEKAELIYVIAGIGAVCDINHVFADMKQAKR
jgi:uncharacterized membrane protein YuzA (DUF378 family)